MSDFAPGDLVECIKPFHGDTERERRILARVGTLGRQTFRVTSYYTTRGGKWRWITLAGVDPSPAHGFNANHFRKLNDGTDDAELIERIRNCKPVRERHPA
jgi:hypothetical protein